MAETRAYQPIDEARTPAADAGVLAEAADWLYSACELYEDEDLDPDDHLEVVRRAYSSSDCDAFAYVVNLMTGWPAVTASWVKDGDLGHHTLLRHPSGRLFDVTGFVDEPALRKRYGARKLSMSAPNPNPPEDVATFGCEEDDEGIDPQLRRVVDVVRSLPDAPFTDADFRALAAKPVDGADVPASEPVPSGP